MYAHLAEKSDRARLDRWLDEPLTSELTDEQRQRRDMERIAEANRAAVASLSATTRLPRP